MIIFVFLLLAEPQEFFSNHPRVSQQTENRVKKLTKFFGDEPPLLRLYLKNLGYEKYAAIFEEAKIGTRNGRLI